MTFIAAFRCRDGIVMCADTEVGINGAKSYAEKIEIIEDRSYPLAIGGAGVEDIILPMSQEIVDRARAEKPATKDELQRLIKSCIEEVYKNDVPLLALKRQFKGTQFLVAAKPTNEEPCIFTIIGRRVYKDAPMAIIGYSTPYNVAMLKRLYRQQLSMQQAVMLAIYLVSQSKKFDEGVGGDTQVIVVRDNGAWIDHPPYVAISEARIAEFLKLTDDLFLSSIDGTIPPSEFPTILDKFRENITNLRQAYLDQTAAISLSRTFSEPMHTGEPYAKIFPGAVVEFGTSGVNTRETTPEEKAWQLEMWQAAKDGNNRVALEEFDSFIRNKPIDYLGQETVQVRGTAGLVSGRDASKD